MSNMKFKVGWAVGDIMHDTILIKTMQIVSDDMSHAVWDRVKFTVWDRVWYTMSGELNDQIG